MMFTRLIPALACATLLTACATGGAGSGSVAKVATTIEGTLAAADAANAAGRFDQAYAMLNRATQVYPTEKAPWLRMAQMHFDANRYGEAIVNALEALQRDPDDTLAHSISAVSGLRVSSKALGDLARKNRISGDVKSEAQDLARLLRTSLGEDVLVPGTKRVTPAKPRPPLSTAAATAATAAGTKAATSSDPFGALK